MTTASAVIAPLIVVVHLAIHATFIGLKKGEPLFILLVAGTGFLLDQLLFGAQVFLVNGVPASAPFWLSCLWPVLATTFMHAFESLQKQLALASLVGAVGGALSYIGGTRLSDVSFGHDVIGPFLLAGLWFVLMPLLLWLAVRLATAEPVPDV